MKVRRSADKRNFVWMAVFIIIFIACFVSPLFCPYSPKAVDLHNVLQKPGSVHLFGTDSIGRDIFSRTLYGGMVGAKATYVLI